MFDGILRDNTEGECRDTGFWLLCVFFFLQKKNNSSEIILVVFYKLKKKISRLGTNMINDASCYRF